MNCRNCGAVYGEGANFCSICGVRVWRQNMAGAVPVSGLLRIREGRMVGGVCAGLSWYYGWDLGIVRVIAVLAAVVTFPIGLIAYIAAWFVVPEEPLLFVPVQQHPVAQQPQG